MTLTERDQEAIETVRETGYEKLADLAERVLRDDAEE